MTWAAEAARCRQCAFCSSEFAHVEYDAVPCNGRDLFGQNVTVSREDAVGIHADKTVVEQALLDFLGNFIGGEGLGEVLDQAVGLVVMLLDVGGEKAGRSPDSVSTSFT